MIGKALDGKPLAGSSRVRRDGGHKLPLLGCALLAALNAGAGVLQLSSDTTWTDLSALNGYDGVEIANGRTLTLNPASGTTMNFDKPISGAGGVIKDGAGNLELRAANTFTGLFIIGGTGDVYAYTDGAFGSSAGRTTLYEHLYTGGGASTESSIAGANLYLCGIVTDEGFDIVTKGEAKYLYAQADTENTINGSVTVSGSQASVSALANATLRLRGGVSGSGTLRPSAASNGKVIIENKPLKSSLWNSMADKGCLVLSAPSNTCGYTYLPIVLDCDWAFDGAAVRWETGSKHMKIDLNGHANRVSNIDATDANMNGWVTSTGGKAFLYYKGTSNVSSYVPFRGSAGLFHEGNVTTTLMKNTTTVSDTKGELCVTNGTVTFETTAAWPNASGVTLSGTGRLTLTAVGQIGDKAVLDISENSLLTLPENGLLTVAAFKLNGTWLAAGDYPVAQLGGFDESDVQRAELQIICELFHLLLQDGYFDFRMPTGKHRNEAVDPGPVDEAVIADGETYFPILAGQRFVKKPAVAVHHMEKPGLHDFSGLRQTNPAALPRKERDLQFPLQFADLEGDRWLGDTHLLCGFGHAAGFSGGKKAFDPVKIHEGSSRNFSVYSIAQMGMKWMKNGITGAIRNRNPGQRPFVLLLLNEEEHLPGIRRLLRCALRQLFR